MASSFETLFLNICLYPITRTEVRQEEIEQNFANNRLLFQELRGKLLTVKLKNPEESL